jgi:GH25 family lysozyme M1 (1,4-beta-N-acetylmuramidase)
MDLFTILVPLVILFFIVSNYRKQKKTFKYFAEKFIRDYGTTLFIVLAFYTYYQYIQYSSDNLIEGIDEKAKEEHVH